MPWEGPTLFRCHLAFRNSGILFSTFSTSQDLRGQTAAPAPTPSTETTAPAPNPWAPQGSQAPPATSGTSATPQGPGLGAALGQGGGMFTSPGMQSLMGQMRWVLSFYGKEYKQFHHFRDNPTLMSQMMSAPYMQGVFRGLADNPDQVNKS